ncbi:hypothetical protein SAMN03080617_00935 [Algoriphagus alkaliphilus]|uniref:Uncharacterized protein n=2 Tax=Algoriphagus alkaliphilus TaxID=279824 RepID=A0A1G5W5B0_9BACT|nr:hypothetical protein SAMN03080617_00935 [Algoriphagus alkaliphilus]
MKTLWEDLSGKVENQEKIRKEELMKMTKKQYQSRLNSIYFPEIFGSIVCFVYAGYFISKIEELELPINQVLAIFNTTVMIILPIISLWTLARLSRWKITDESPSILVEKFKKDKVFFWKFQRFNLLLSGLFAISILPPLAELLGKKDLILEPTFWLAYVPLGLIAIYVFGRITIKKYKRSLEEAQQLIEGIA